LRVTSQLKLLNLLHLSRPATDRAIYQAIAKSHARKMLEFGIGLAERAAKMIEVAKCFAEASEIRFIGVDAFEDRAASDGPGLPLKEAYQILHSRGVRAQLIPGNVLDGLARSANMLGKVDLLLFSAQTDAAQLEQAWFYVPRLLHEQSQVFVEQRSAEGKISMRPIDAQEIRSLANAAQRRRSA
jgi:hypothetical protein